MQIVITLNSYEELEELQGNLARILGGNKAEVMPAPKKAPAKKADPKPEPTPEPEPAKTEETEAKAEDPAYLKRLEGRMADASFGEYMRDRRIFLSAVVTFCQQLFLLSRGTDFSLLPNPEVFVSGKPDQNISEAYGDQVLKEAEELMFTLRFNVPEELALRTFAVNLAV